MVRYHHLSLWSIVSTKKNYKFFSKKKTQNKNMKNKKVKPM